MRETLAIWVDRGINSRDKKIAFAFLSLLVNDTTIKLKRFFQSIRIGRSNVVLQINVLCFRRSRDLSMFFLDYIFAFGTYFLALLFILVNSFSCNISSCVRQVISTSISPQPAITCSKLTIETLEQGVKYVKNMYLYC